MSEKKFELLVLIGRFRPFHNGHKHVIDKALEKAHNVLVLVGSANRPRTFKNPWTAFEVSQMIGSVYKDEELRGRINIVGLDDWMHDNDFRWLMNVQRAVDTEKQRIQQWVGHTDPFRIGLVGFSKDHTSYYLKKFPQYGSVDVGPFKTGDKILNATDLRNALMTGEQWTSAPEVKQGVPKEVLHWLEDWIRPDEHSKIIEGLVEAAEFAKEYKVEHQYKGKLDPKTGLYLGKPYQPIMTTVDSVVIQSGHVLMGRRKFNPGKGLWALPGGFGHANEWLRDANARERSEETRIKLSRNVLDLAFRFKHVFSDPNRSDDRGRIITHVYLHLLNDRAELAFVEADDDFEEVAWIPLGLMDPNDTYSDHFWVVHKMIDMIPVD
jgi:bifunctional NMN adenylyltransferase/nudix hydrolase